MLYALEFLGSLTTNGVVPRIHRSHIYGVSVNLYSQYQTNARIDYLYQSVIYNSAEVMCEMANCISNQYGLTKQRTVREEDP